MKEGGCDVRVDCGFYCTCVQGKSKTWALMVEKFCNGEDFLLCARRDFYKRTGYCAPLDMTPVGYLPVEILAAMQKDP
jgi:hypothetical protein